MRSRCKTVFGPTPPAKANIATALLTNVIEHLVLLFPPNKHAFTAKAVWADFHSVKSSSPLCQNLAQIAEICLPNEDFNVPVTLANQRFRSIQDSRKFVEGRAECFRYFRFWFESPRDLQQPCCIDLETYESPLHWLLATGGVPVCDY